MGEGRMRVRNLLPLTLILSHSGERKLILVRGLGGEVDTSSAENNVRYKYRKKFDFTSTYIL
jgi:hypothetical protein